MTRKSCGDFFGAMLLVGLSLLPMLASGFYGDDEANALLTATLLEMKGQSLVALMKTDIVSWATAVGRFFPLAEYHRVFFWLIDGNLLAYKSILMGMVLVNAALLHAVTRRLTASTGLANVTVVSFALTLQFRVYHEPILSYMALLPVVTALVLASINWFLHHLEGGARSRLFLSVSAFGVSLLVYEVALPMCVVFVGLAALYPGKRTVAQALKASWMFLAIAGLAVVNVVVLRLAFDLQPSTAGQLSAYQPNFSPAPFTITVVKQVLASFPLTYYLSRMTAFFLGMTSRPLYDSPLAYLHTHLNTTLLCATVFFGVGLRVIRTHLAQSNWSSPSGRMRVLVLLGLAFLVLPNTLIALAAKHQTGVGWGEGYLPAYMSAVGVALLMAAAFQWLCNSAVRQHRSAHIGIPLALICGLAGALNFDNNRITVETLNRARSYPAGVTEKALAAGLLNAVPSGSWLISNVLTAWQVPDFYRLHAGKSLAGVVAVTYVDTLMGLPLRKVAGDLESTSYTVSPEAPPVFYIHLDTGTRDAGYAMLVRVQSIMVNGQGISVTGSPLVGYHTWPTPAPYDWQPIKGWPLGHLSYQRADIMGTPMNSGRVIVSGPEWSLNSAPAGWNVTVPNFNLKTWNSSLGIPEPKWSLAQ